MSAAAGQVASEAVTQALAIGQRVLDSVTDYYYEDAAMLCYWNDWKARDQQARIQKTYNNGRFR